VARRSLLDLDIADVTQDVLRELIAEGETDLVERKEHLPGGGLGPTVASFANSGGGWVLLGVTNDGEAKGCSAPGRAEPQDWLRTLIRKDVDPLPSFEARAVAIDGVEVIVVRVHASALTPHLYVPAGAVYIREHGGRHPIKTQAALIALTVRPGQAQQEAYARMTSLPLVKLALGPHRPPSNPVNGETRIVDWILTAGPLMVPQDFRARALSRTTADAIREQVAELINAVGPPGQGGVERHPHGSGIVVAGRNLANGAEVHVLLDAGGVAVVRLRERLTRSVLYVPRLADDIITPLLPLATKPLELSGASGATHLHFAVDIQVTTEEEGWRASIAVGTAHDSGELHSGAFVGGDIELPADDTAIKAIAEGWMRELARTAGLEWWEDA
jgi:hypothetical protein